MTRASANASTTMTEPSIPAPRPVSLVAVFAVFLLLSLFGVLAEKVYLPGRPALPQNETPENLSKDMAWKATPETRRAYLADLRKKQGEQAAAYGWVDQKNGVVQLPIRRAMELVIQEHGGSR
jgi:hypothetical protein